MADNNMHVGSIGPSDLVWKAGVSTVLLLLNDQVKVIYLHCKHNIYLYLLKPNTINNQSETKAN